MRSGVDEKKGVSITQRNNRTKGFGFARYAEKRRKIKNCGKMEERARKWERGNGFTSSNNTINFNEILCSVARVLFRAWHFGWIICQVVSGACSSY